MQPKIGAAGIKDSTWESKEHIIRTKLLPYFGKLKMSSITPQQYRSVAE